MYCAAPGDEMTRGGVERERGCDMALLYPITWCEMPCFFSLTRRSDKCCVNSRVDLTLRESGWCDPPVEGGVVLLVGFSVTTQPPFRE
jgi:hypothetical protein